MLLCKMSSSWHNTQDLNTSEHVVMSNVPSLAWQHINNYQERCRHVGRPHFDVGKHNFTFQLYAFRGCTTEAWDLQKGTCFFVLLHTQSTKTVTSGQDICSCRVNVLTLTQQPQCLTGSRCIEKHRRFFIFFKLTKTCWSQMQTD